MITGSGKATLSGVTSKLKVNITGSGKFNGFDLRSKETTVNITGSGDAEVVSQDSLNAVVTGSGSVRYKGEPKNKSVSTLGSGSIKNSD